jgi:hypothetical protein
MNAIPKMIDRVTAPVDPDLFVEMSNVFQAAARRPLPKPKRRTPGYYLTDIPLNRGMLGTVAALRKKTDSSQMEPILFRLMHLGEIFEAREQFGHFIRDREDAEGVDVSEALLMAAAVARIAATDAGSYFDLDDVLQHAHRFDAQDRAAKEKAN